VTEIVKTATIEDYVIFNWNKTVGYKVVQFKGENQKYKVSRLINTVGR
jgi:hypothetical protein